MPSVRKIPPETTICPVAGCYRRTNDRTGMCPAHIHQPGCRCRLCASGVAVRSVQIFVPSTSAPGGFAQKQVSVSREPWG